MRRPTSVIGGKADMAQACHYDPQPMFQPIMALASAVQQDSISIPRSMARPQRPAPRSTRSWNCAAAPPVSGAEISFERKWTTGIFGAAEFGKGGRDLLWQLRHGIPERNGL
jgi:hypothetical protein